MRWRNLITSVIRAVEKKTNRTVVVGFVGILQISHKFWRIPEIAVRLQKIRNGAKRSFLYRLLKTNNTPIELLWFKFGVLFILEVTAGFEPADNGVADRGLTTWLRHHAYSYYDIIAKCSAFVKSFFVFSQKNLIDENCIKKSRLLRWRICASY